MFIAERGDPLHPRETRERAPRVPVALRRGVTLVRLQIIYIRLYPSREIFFVIFHMLLLSIYIVNRFRKITLRQK